MESGVFLINEGNCYANWWGNDLNLVLCHDRSCFFCVPSLCITLFNQDWCLFFSLGSWLVAKCFLQENFQFGPSSSASPPSLSSFPGVEFDPSARQPHRLRQSPPPVQGHPAHPRSLMLGIGLKEYWAKPPPARGITSSTNSGGERVCCNSGTGVSYSGDYKKISKIQSELRKGNWSNSCSSIFLSMDVSTRYTFAFFVVDEALDKNVLFLLRNSSIWDAWVLFAFLGDEATTFLFGSCYATLFLFRRDLVRGISSSSSSSAPASACTRWTVGTPISVLVHKKDSLVHMGLASAISRGFSSWLGTNLHILLKFSFQ